MEWIPLRCSRWESINPAGPAPTMPTCVSNRAMFRQSPHRALVQDLPGSVERGIRGGNPAIDRAMQKNLANLLRRDSVVRSCTHVKTQLFAAVQCNHQPDGQQAA